MKNILLPTDFSDNAWNAIFTMLKLYADLQCRFYLLHAFEPKTMNMMGRKSQQRLGTIYSSLSQYSEQELVKSLEYLTLHHQNPKHGFEIISKSDTLEGALTQVVAENYIDLIGMGTQGATGSKQVFMGSNTVRALKSNMDCPLLAIPADYNFQSLNSLAFPTDFLNKFTESLLLPMTELAALWKTDIHIIYVAQEFKLNDQQRINQKVLKEHLQGLNVVFQNIDFEANITNTLEKFVDNTNMDLMTLLKNHHSFWEKLIREPIVKKMTFHAKVPLLVLPG